MSQSRVSWNALVLVTSANLTRLYITPAAGAVKIPASRRGVALFASPKSNSGLERDAHARGRVGADRLDELGVLHVADRLARRDLGHQTGLRVGRVVAAGADRHVRHLGGRRAGRHPAEELRDQQPPGE